MVLRENKNNAYSKFGGTNKEYYGIFESGLLSWSEFDFRVKAPQRSVIRLRNARSIFLTDHFVYELS